jgi:hypothetical protein
MTIVIVCHLNTNGYITKTCKGTGRNGRRKNIGTGEVSMTVGDTVNKKAGAKGIKDKIEEWH